MKMSMACMHQKLFPEDSEYVLDRKPHAGAVVVPEVCKLGWIPLYDSTVMECVRC